MVVITTILYPKGTFDLKYYVEKHMPFVKSKWTSYGLQKYEIISLPAEPGEPLSLYSLSISHDP
jgi:hypothetical protein